MRILVDTNRIIAAFLKSGTTRDILFDSYFDFFTPDYSITELNNHKEEIKKRSGITDEEFDLVLAVLFERITIMPHSEYSEAMNRYKHDISDPADIPHLAAAIVSNAEGIWTHDQHFQEQKKVTTYTNKDMLVFLSRTTSNRSLTPAQH
ncbi:PIN domain-containing protein [Candidatus Woesearchaeota archaeon]|nr:PIN domain-containing protein [Candidatus Woesearchaeota archaeon]